MAYSRLIHISGGIDTISGLVAYRQFKARGITIGSFVSTKDSSGVTNLERIYERYTPSDFDDDTKFLDDTKADVQIMKNLTEEGAVDFVPKFDILKSGTELVVYTSDIHKNLPSNNASPNRPVNIEPFMATVLKNLVADDDYVDERAIDDSKFGLFDRNPSATVWIWMKSLGDGNHISGKLVDVTSFLTNVSVSKDKQSGQFTVGLSYVYSELLNIMGSTVYDSIINSADSNGIRRRNQSQFHSLVSKNDVVFIRLSRLKNEKDGTTLNPDNWELDTSVINGKIFDMIGLVDSAKDGFNGGSGMATATVSGQDLSRLLTDDGSSIYQNRYVSSGRRSEEIEISSDIFRLWGKHTSLFTLQDQTIGKQLLFVLDYMTRSKMCDGLFSSSPNARRDKLDIGEGNSFVAADVSGIWQVVDVGVDADIAGYTSFNSRLGNDYSNIMSQLSQVCAEPFVELYTDTYGDRFNIMARKPPFDKASVKFWANSETTRTIRESDIIGDVLDYDQRAFSWYKIDIRFLSAAFDANFRWLFPAKHFKEFEDIFGDKPYQCENPYINHDMYESNDKSATLLGKRMINAGLMDFKYVIESNAYLPFTRTGSITINGDRTYKRGTWVRHEGTSEIFYIDNISHSAMFAEGTDWSTTLNVSRGMVEQYLDGYFELIDMPIFEMTSNDTIEFMERILLGWNVNPEVFEFFVKRKQLNKIRNDQ